MAISHYNKLFISQIIQDFILDDDKLNLDISRIFLKSSVLGVITAIKKFVRRTVYTVDDGTGSLDCVLWNNESTTTKKTNQLRYDLENQNVLSSEAAATCYLLLNKIEINKEAEVEYSHGDKICCLGSVKWMKGKLLLVINHHYKVDKVNAETLWILDVLSGLHKLS